MLDILSHRPCKHALVSMNTTPQPPPPPMWGGTGVISLGELKHYSMGSGTDESGLGRWTWAQCRGKNNISLRAVSIHQPCANKDGVMSAWAQQKAYLQDQNDDRDPRSAFREDLQKQIQTWIDTGDQLIVGGASTSPSYTHRFHLCFRNRD